MKNKITKALLKGMSAFGFMSLGSLIRETLANGFYSWVLGLGMILAVLVAVLPMIEEINESEDN